MERLLAGFSALGWREYLFAAGMAYVLTYIYRVFQRRKESGKNKEKTYVIQTFDKRAIDRCKELFPIDVLSFKGKEFKRGMQIRITTIQQNVIVGEFIASRAGIGYLIVYGGQVFKLDIVMMGVFVLAIFTLIMYQGVSMLENYLRKKQSAKK